MTLELNRTSEAPKKTPVDPELIQSLIDNYSIHRSDCQEHRHQIYREMRERCPVAHSKEHGGYYMLSRYRDVYDAAHVPEKLSSFPVTIPAFGNPTPMIPLEVDPPMHAKYRQLVGGPFSPKAVDAHENAMRGMVRDILDNLEGRTEVDLAKDIAIPLPLRAILELYLGVPRKDWEMLRDKFLVMLQPDAELSDEENNENAMQSGMDCTVYFAGLLDDLRQNGHGEDLISYLDQVEIEGERLDDEEILGFCLVLVPAGFDTTASAVSRIMLMMAEEPELRTKIEGILDDENRLGVAVEELIRYISPLPALARNVTEDCKVGDAELSEEDRVLLLWPSANRDPEEFDAPDELRLDRHPNRHLAFGSGVHRCLGSHLAKLEIKVLLQEFLRRMPRYQVDTDKGAVWHTGNTWGVKSLPVVFDQPVPSGSN